MKNMSDNQVYQMISNNIKSYRVEMGMTQRELIKN